MEMCYDGVLVMPSKFIAIGEEEMTYVEGGYTINISTSTAATIIDVGMIVATAGLAATNNLGKIAAKIGWTKLKKYARTAAISCLRKSGLSYARAKIGANMCVDILQCVSGLSVGAAIAEALDRVDGNNNNSIQF